MQANQTYLLRDTDAAVRILGTVKTTEHELRVRITHAEGEYTAYLLGEKENVVRAFCGSEITLPLPKGAEATLFLMKEGKPIAYAAESRLSQSKRQQLLSGILQERKEAPEKELAQEDYVLEEITDPLCKEDPLLFEEPPIATYNYYLQPKQPFYFEQIKESLLRLLERYPKERTLEELIPCSHFAEIRFDERGHSYAVGYVEMEGVPAYLVYAVPSPYRALPPKSLAGFTRFLPADVQEPFGNGYFLLFESADTGMALSEG